MTMEEDFCDTKIFLDEPFAIFYAGQMLTGRIDIKISRPQTYSAINLNFIGEAKVNWNEYEFEEYNGVRRDITVNYGGTETYFNVTQCIAGGSGTTVTLPEGVSNIPFQFSIPHISPSSFHGERGSVKYKMVAYIEYPDPLKARKQLEKVFSVVAPLDCNKGDDIKRPINMEFEEIYSCCCSSTPMHIIVNMPHSGFCPGQAIPITIQVHNETNVEINQIILQLIRKECYHSKEPKSVYIPPDQILETVKTRPILSKTKGEYKYTMVVPDMIAPNLQNCSIIDVGFFVKATVQPSGCNDDMENEVEICLGLVPIASTVENEPYRHPMQNDLPQGAVPDIAEVAAPVQVHNNTADPSAYTAQTTNYPSTVPYPYPGGAYPNVTPHPQHVPNLANIGFVMPPPPWQPVTSPHSGSTVPYPSNVGSQIPYPTYSAPSAPPPT